MILGSSLAMAAAASSGRLDAGKSNSLRDVGIKMLGKGDEE